MEYEKAYVYQPEYDRPTKRRRTEPRGLQTSWERRRQAYQTAWKAQEVAIDACLGTLNAKTVTEVAEFLDIAASDSKSDRIPTAIIVTGAEGSSDNAVTRRLVKRPAFSKGKRLLVTLPSNFGPNLKALLKALIQNATQQQSGMDDEDDDLQSVRRKGPRLLNYDLQMLYDYVRRHQVEQVVVALPDTETFDSDLLSELLEMLVCWNDRIPFACIFNIATSVEFMQQRLSKAAIAGLNGRLFDSVPTGEELEQVFAVLVESKPPLWLGAGLMSMLLERQSDYIQSMDSFVNAVKYAYMSAYYANPLSVFFDAGGASITTDHYEALRSLDSFRSFARQLLDNGEAVRLKTYLDSDEPMTQLATEKLIEGSVKIECMMVGLRMLRVVQQSLPNIAISGLSNLYVQAMSGKLQGSAMLRSILLTIKKVPSDVAMKLLDAAIKLQVEPMPRTIHHLQVLHAELQTLLNSQPSHTHPLRSEDDLRNSTLRTTVVAQKVELSKHKSTLSKQDKAYTELMTRVSQTFSDFFAETLVDPKGLLFHEIFIYDLKSPYREVFTPRPRHAIERALAEPHDYLDCECCAPEQEGGGATLASTQPVTAVLYQLYLESGSLINASDIWQAFQAVMGDGQEEAETMALFQRASAELRYLGMLKTTRKRVDHVAKVMWRGL